MNKCELAFLLSYLKKAIFNLERVRAYDETTVSEEIITELKQTLILYKHRKDKEYYEKQQ